MLSADAQNNPSVTKHPKLLFISWAPHCSRSDSIAKHLGGPSFMVYAGYLGSNVFTAPLKYLFQAIHTFWILIRWRPEVVLVMSPPIIACFPVYFYSKLFGARYAIDAHTGAFLNRLWERLEFLQRFFSRRAVTTIVTNEFLKQRVEQWGAHATIITDVPVDFAEPDEVNLGSGCHMTVVASFCPDEPIEEVFKAARQCPDVTFHITGDPRSLDASVRQQQPDNVRMLGFLTKQQYVGQLLASDAIVALTTRNHTMQRAAYEAIYLERPVITSDFPVLRKSFAQGAVHVMPDSDGIAGGVKTMQGGLDRYAEEARQLRVAKLADWKDATAVLQRLLGLASDPNDDRAEAAQNLSSATLHEE